MTSCSGKSWDSRCRKAAVGFGPYRQARVSNSFLRSLLAIARNTNHSPRRSGCKAGMNSDGPVALSPSGPSVSTSALHSVASSACGISPLRAASTQCRPPTIVARMAIRSAGLFPPRRGAPSPRIFCHREPQSRSSISLSSSSRCKIRPDSPRLGSSLAANTCPKKYA